jgi:hypothetical protein
MGRLTILACTALALCGCNVHGLDLPDATPRIDAAPPEDSIEYPDTSPPVEFALQFVDPDHGPYRGGTEVMVRGVGFDADTQVLIGGRSIDPLDFQFVDSRRIIVRTPPGEPGLADVQVQKGAEEATLAGAFRYEALYVDPPVGAIAGGTFVTITGLGTDFGSGTAITFDGVEMTGVTVLGEQALTGFTPPGTAGTADVRVTTATAIYEARRAFTYQATGDSFSGGMSGGPIQGTVNVVVVDSNSGDGIPGAYVVLGDPATSTFQGFADALGQITFSDPALTGPMTVTAAAATYETNVFVGYDAQNITIFLRKPPPPANGPLPPAPRVGRILGHVLFGDATTLGSPYWNLVPEPRTPTEVKRIYVTTTAPTPFSVPYPPVHAIDYQYHPDVVAWEFEAYARPSATAVVAIAGLYDPMLDPSGRGVTGFEPFAMGVARGVLVGPGETVVGVDVVINIPLDGTAQVTLDAPPALDTPGWNGPNYYKLRPFVDLGGEGVILMNKNGLPTPPPPEDRPNHYRFEPGSDTIVLPGMVPLTGVLSDASYGFIAGAYTGTDSNPYSVRVVRGVPGLDHPVTLGDFLGVARPTDPAPESTASGMRLHFDIEGPPTTEPTFHLHILTTGTGEPLLRMFTRGDILDVDIPDVTYGGLPPFPTEEDISWTIWRIKVAGATFDQFTYRQLGTLYWDSYMADAFWVQFPGPMDTP